jgi:hypothetical protein
LAGISMIVLVYSCFIAPSACHRAAGVAASNISGGPRFYQIIAATFGLRRPFA